uniref:Asialoglycoprotein receptor-like 1 n=1 Tax=Seriola dumerili TaxID=41447 RepID=A0A3B4T4A0_SERDU
MDYQFHQFGPPDNSSLSGEIKITTQPGTTCTCQLILIHALRCCLKLREQDCHCFEGMKRIVAFVLYGFLVLLLLILLMNSLFFCHSHCMTCLNLLKPGICKDGWMSFRESCYLLSTTVTTWIKAQSLCITQGGHLLVLNNVEELDYISSVVQIYSNYWIGLVERHQEGHWTWVDGTDFASTPTFWDEGQPDNWAFRENGEDCGQLHASDRRKRKRWNDADCSLQYQYICESRA